MSSQENNALVSCHENANFYPSTIISPNSTLEFTYPHFFEQVPSVVIPDKGLPALLYHFFCCHPLFFNFEAYYRYDECPNEI